MQPTSGRVFVKKVQANQSKFELSGNDQYQVTAVADDVTGIKVGDFVLFNNYHQYVFRGEEFIRVNESDVEGVCTAK